MLCVGIDAGSRAIKVVLMDAGSLGVIASGTADQGVEHNALALRLFDQVIKRSGCSRDDVSRIVATGYARNGVSIADTTITEITCHACGVHHLVPDARTIVEIGGQDSKLLRLTGEGVVYDFAMNDRCAAGTGRFLELVADRLAVELQALGEMAGRSERPAAISSMCAVFAETEIIGLLASGVAPEDIAAGVQVSIAGRVATMAGRNLTPPIIFTGGVAMTPGMAKALESAFGQPVSTAPDPQMTGALGAAILASRQLQSKGRQSV
jgi:predicted CoA-substrate-specific enzyme activase